MAWEGEKESDGLLCNWQGLFHTVLSMDAASMLIPMLTLTAYCPHEIFPPSPGSWALAMFQDHIPVAKIRVNNLLYSIASAMCLLLFLSGGPISVVGCGSDLLTVNNVWSV